MTDRFRDRLSEYIDGELDPRERKLVGRHLEECGECSRTVEELRAVVARAGRLGEREPPGGLWAGIEERILSPGAPGSPGDESHDVEAPSPGRRVGAVRRISFSIPQLAAATITVATLSGAAAWMTIGGGTDAGTAGPSDETTRSAVTLTADGAGEPGAGPETPSEYAAAIAELEQVLFDPAAPLPADIEATVRRALVTIDRAIEDARAALARLPGDPYLREHVTSTLRRKAEFLRNAVRLARS